MGVADKGTGLCLGHQPVKIVQDVGDQAGAHGDRGADADDVFLASFFHIAFQLVELCNDRIGIVQKFLSGGGDMETSG